VVLPLKSEDVKMAALTLEVEGWHGLGNSVHQSMTLSGMQLSASAPEGEGASIISGKADSQEYKV
jgi:hypothetical protein